MTAATKSQKVVRKADNWGAAPEHVARALKAPRTRRQTKSVRKAQ